MPRQAKAVGQGTVGFVAGKEDVHRQVQPLGGLLHGAAHLRRVINGIEKQVITLGRRAQNGGKVLRRRQQGRVQHHLWGAAGQLFNHRHAFLLPHRQSGKVRQQTF